MSDTPDPIAKAERIAQAAHAGQVDKLGVPYMEHVHAVARGVAPLGTAHQVVALLHDTLEDCDDPAIVSPEMLARTFGDEIASAVDAITKRDSEDYAHDYIPRVLANPLARAVKRADVAHNLSRLHLLDPDTRDRLGKKYAALLSQLDPGP